MASGRTVAIILAAIAVPMSLAAGREAVVAALPPTAALYAALGLRVNLDRLEIGTVSATVRYEQDVRVLVVDTDIKNPRAASLPVPPLRLSIRNANGSAIYTWTSTPPTKTLAAGARTPVRARLTAPPAGETVVVEFVRPAA